MVHLEERLAKLSPDALAGTLRGIEKESLRVTPDGRLATTPHPAALGAALTHPNITTDFSESQIELITGVHPDADACVQELMEIHQFVYRALGDEMLWASSMPCRLPPDDRIPLGQYGRSNVGRLKTVYRMGLSRRYGSRMQTISGVHYNFSLSEPTMGSLQRTLGDTREAVAFRTDAYFALIRNFRRHSWLPLYLFGASPATCRSFVEGRSHRLQDLSADTLYLPHATSLRMGPLGYQSDAQRRLARGGRVEDLDPHLQHAGVTAEQAVGRPLGEERPARPQHLALPAVAAAEDLGDDDVTAPVGLVRHRLGDLRIERLPVEVERLEPVLLQLGEHQVEQRPDLVGVAHVRRLGGVEHRQERLGEPAGRPADLGVAHHAARTLLLAAC